MIKMCNLIQKDFLFSAKWFFIGVVLTLFAPVYFIYLSDISNAYVAPVFMLSAIFGCNIAISRVCYLEDNYPTKKFLNAMPVSKLEVIAGRYIGTFILTILLLLLAIAEAAVLDMSLPFTVILIGAFGGLMFEGTYLFFFYKWGTNVAQYSFLGVAGLLGLVYFISDKFDISLSFIMEWKGLLVLIGVAIYLLSAYLSWRYHKAD